MKFRGCAKIGSAKSKVRGMWKFKGIKSIIAMLYVITQILKIEILIFLVVRNLFREKVSTSRTYFGEKPDVFNQT